MAIFTRDPIGLIHANQTKADLFAALGRAERAMRADGSYYDVSQFMGGYLFDGLPTNVVFDSKWYPGQQEALQPAWNSGAIPRPPAAVLAYPIVGNPNQTPAAAGGIPPTVLIGGALLLLWWFRK